MGSCRNVRGMGKSTFVFRLYLEKKYLNEENGNMVAVQISPKIESVYGLGRQVTKL